MTPARTLHLTVGLDEDHEEAIRRRAARALGVGLDALGSLYVLKRSIDARGGRVRFSLVVQIGGEDPNARLGEPHPREVKQGPPVVIVGEGPAGLFCAYELARHGVGATVVDRGKPVQLRRRDLKGLNRRGVVDPESNYCFGEGGAGTYSDGKLYTRSTKRGDVRDVLEILALHGAPEAILVDARPHIGSNKLPKVVTAMRERLENVGVVFRFGAKVVDLAFEATGSDRRVKGVVLADGATLEACAVVIATGHSARDVWRMLAVRGISLEAKPFALGVRIEHPQPLINEIQYGSFAGHARLPNAAYRIAETCGGRGVFSFCMCPGGFIVPASTEPGALVVNGMSLSRRDSPFANSGLVVAVEVEDALAQGRQGPFAGVELQASVERAAWEAGGGALVAPATRVTDFLARRGSTTAPKTSYQPGLKAGDVGEVLDVAGLPLADRLREALLAFGRRMPGYVTEEAVLVGVESRTSSPVRVLRDAETLESPDARGLYPCGEGAGFAGGIVSAALDGMRVARRIARSFA